MTVCCRYYGCLVSGIGELPHLFNPKGVFPKCRSTFRQFHLNCLASRHNRFHLRKLFFRPAVIAVFPVSHTGDPMIFPHSPEKVGKLYNIPLKKLPKQRDIFSKLKNFKDVRKFYKNEIKTKGHAKHEG